MYSLVGSLMRFVSQIWKHGVQIHGSEWMNDSKMNSFHGIKNAKWKKNRKEFGSSLNFILINETSTTLMNNSARRSKREDPMTFWFLEHVFFFSSEKSTINERGELVTNWILNRSISALILSFFISGADTTSHFPKTNLISCNF